MRRSTCLRVSGYLSVWVTNSTHDSTDLNRSALPVCGGPVEEITLENYIGAGVGTEQACVAESNADSQDYLLYHQDTE